MRQNDVFPGQFFQLVDLFDNYPPIVQDGFQFQLIDVTAGVARTTALARLN